MSQPPTADAPAIQHAWGNDNVQISHVVGSTITITYGGEPEREVPLQPAALHFPAAAPSQPPAMLIRARYGVVPFVDYTGLLGELTTWCDSGQDFGIRLLAGPGGTGKTRTAVRLCEEVGQRKWLAGMLKASTDAEELDALVTAPTARLVVVDYAESRRQQLGEVVPLLAQHASADHPVRVVLTVRAHPASSDWLAPLRGINDEFDAWLVPPSTMVDVISDRPPDATARHQLYLGAHQAFARYLSLPARDEPSVELGMPMFANPLMVVIAAFLAVHPAPVPTTADELMEQLIDPHEDHYWQSSAAGQDPPLEIDRVLRRRVVALATLASADSEVEGARLLGLIDELASEASTERRYQLARWAGQLYGGSRFWSPLKPDMVAEHLVATTHGDSPAVLNGALIDRSVLALPQPLALLARAVVGRPSLALKVSAILDQELKSLCDQAVEQAAAETSLQGLLGPNSVAAALAALVGACPPDPGKLDPVLEALTPRAHLALTPLALVLTEQLIAHFRTAAEGDPGAILPDLAMALNSQSIFLSDLGRREAALAAIEEATSIARPLADPHPDAFSPDLAMMLANQSRCLSDLGRLEEALAATEEATSICRPLADAHPEAFLPDLARTLSNQSSFLSELGRREEALAAIAEATGIYRSLAAAHPAAFLPDLARTLSNQSSFLSQLGRREEALAAIEEATSIHRPLAAAQPDRFLSEMAMMLSNHSRCLGEVGRREEALGAIEEATSIYRPMAEARPDAFLSDLAMTLSSQSRCLSDVGRHEDALAAIDEAVAIRRQLAASRPYAFLADLAVALNNQSNRLSELGRADEALTAIEEATSIYRPLAAARPQSYAPDLAVALNNQSLCLSELGRGGEAVAAREEVVKLTGPGRRL